MFQNRIFVKICKRNPIERKNENQVYQQMSLWSNFLIANSENGNLVPCIKSYI